MSVAGILSSLSQFQLGGPTVAKQGLQQLGQALQSGNLTAAQSDFATLQQAFAQTATPSATTSSVTSPVSSTGSSPTASPVTQAFNQLASDLQSGNLSASQKDFSNLQQDVQSVNGTGSAGNLRHHHHFGGGSGGSGSSSAQNTLLQDLNQLGQSPTSSSSPNTLSSATLSSALQAYSSLQAKPLDAFGGGQLQAESPVSMLA